MLQNRVVLCLVSIFIYKAAPINGNVCSTFYTATSAVDTFPLTDHCIEVTKFSSEPAVVLVQGGTIPNGEDCKIYKGLSLDMEDLLRVIKNPGIGWVDIPEGSAFTVDCTSAADIVIGIMEVEYNSAEVLLPTPGTTAYEAQMLPYPTNFTDEVVFRSSVQCTFYIQNFGIGIKPDDWLFMLPDEDSPDAGFRVNSVYSFDTAETRSLQAKILRLQLASFGVSGNGDAYMFRITANESCVQDFPPTEPPPPPPSPELECGEDGEVKIRLSNDTLDDLQVEENDAIVISSLPVHDLNSIDLGCVANSTHPEFNLGITNCSSVESTGDLLQATFTVRRHIYFNQSQPIQRYNYDSCVNLTCEWNLTVVVNSSAIFPEIKKLELDAVEEKGEFDVGISFTNDSTYSTELPENSAVKVSDYVHVKVDLTGVDLDSSLHLQLTDCWARPNEIATGSPMYSIINDSCPADNSFDPDDAIMIDRNYDVKYSIFKFRSFVWTLNQEQAIYVYCDVTICHNDVGSGCDSQPACLGDKRRKRDLESSQSQHRVVASGPIFIAQNKKENCEELNGGCSDLCELRHDHVICSCYNGRKLQENGKICEEAENHELVEIFEEKNDSILLAAVALVALVTIVVGVVLKQRSRSKKKNVLNVA